MKTNQLIALLSLGLFVSCASDGPFEKRKREFKAGEYSEKQKPVNGSLMATGSGFLEDDKPVAVGDIIIVRVDEADSASHDTRTKLDRKSTANYGITGALANMAPDQDLPHLLGGQSEYDFNGGGTVERHGKLTAMMPVRVEKIMPNGDLYVEGTKVVIVGSEERHLYISGIVRPADVLSDGSVLSSRVSDAEIEYASRGDASNQQKEGWLTKILNNIWPF